jgi:two-component system, NarL family, sensor histidine kinase DesK
VPLWREGAFFSLPPPRATLRVHVFLRLAFVAVFATAFWARTSPSRQRSPSLDLQLLGAQTVIALLGPTELVHVVAAELAIVLPLRSAWRRLGALVLADVAVKIPFIMGVVGDLNFLANPGGITLCVAWDSALHPAFFGMGLFFSAERLGRVRPARAHSELRATQQLLADAIRASERARIARDLHDALGHNLTALNLHPDLAARQAAAEDIESLRLSRELAQCLLAEVRATVSAQRRQRAINSRQALATLCTGIPFPSVALSYDERIEIREPTVADTSFRTVQEAVTNPVRHSGAAAVRVPAGRRAGDLGERRWRL